MKNIYKVLLSLFGLLVVCINTNAQSLKVSGSLFIPQDSIGFTYDSPKFSTTDWIGIYKVDQKPGGPASASWKYIPKSSGTLYLNAPDVEGKYKAFLLCCDGYDTIAISSEFSIAVPELTSSSPSYIKGDSIVFSFTSPKFSNTDWIGIYPSGTKPGSENPSIDWKYIPKSSGKITFKNTLSPDLYDAYLLCCDGYDSLAACTFEVFDANTAFVTPKKQNFEAGTTLDFYFSDPDFKSGDWIGIYPDGEDPTLVPSITWSQIISNSGTVSFPGVLTGGVYYAVLFCCGNTDKEYARSVSFIVDEGATGTYIKTGASVYPKGIPILVNYRDENFTDKDWIGIYKNGEIPGGGHESLLWSYAKNDSSTIQFNPLPIGDYVVYLLCCDGYKIMAKKNFKVVDSNTPSIVASEISYLVGAKLEFTYNSSTFSSTDWVGIYNAGDIPGSSGVYSIWWKYLPDANGIMRFSYPDNLGENSTPTSLYPGEYWAGLFCCDAYGLYAQTSFFVTDKKTGIPEFNLDNRLTIYPNPTDGFINIKISDGDKLQRIIVYNLTGQVLYQEQMDGSVNQRSLDLKHFNKGVYFVEVLADKYKTSKKLIIQ